MQCQMTRTPPSVCTVIRKCVRHTLPQIQKLKRLCTDLRYRACWIVFGRQFYDQTLSDLCVRLSPVFFSHFF